MHEFACHDCVYKCRRHGRGGDLPHCLCHQPDSPKCWAWGRVPGGRWALSRVLTVRLFKQRPDTLIRTSSRGWNNMSPATSALFLRTHPNVSSYKLSSGRHSAHLYMWCNSTERLEHFLNIFSEWNLGFTTSLGSKYWIYLSVRLFKSLSMIPSICGQHKTTWAEL